jgi:hypothetical protein
MRPQSFLLLVCLIFGSALATTASPPARKLYKNPTWVSNQFKYLKVPGPVFTGKPSKAFTSTESSARTAFKTNWHKLVRAVKLKALYKQPLPAYLKTEQAKYVKWISSNFKNLNKRINIFH